MAGLPSRVAQARLGSAAIEGAAQAVVATVGALVLELRRRTALPRAPASVAAGTLFWQPAWVTVAVVVPASAARAAQAP